MDPTGLRPTDAIVGHLTARARSDVAPHPPCGGAGVRVTATGAPGVGVEDRLGAPLPPRRRRQGARATRPPHIARAVHALKALTLLPDGQDEGVAPPRIIHTRKPPVGAPRAGTKTPPTRAPDARLVMVITRRPCAGREAREKLGARGQARAIAIAEAASGGAALLMDAAARDPAPIPTGPVMEAMPLLVRPVIPEAVPCETGRAEGLPAGIVAARRRPLIPLPVRRRPVMTGAGARDKAPAAPGGLPPLTGPTLFLNTVARAEPPTTSGPTARADTPLIPEARQLPGVGLHLRRTATADIVADPNGADAPVTGQLLPERPGRVGVAIAATVAFVVRVGAASSRRARRRTATGVPEVPDTGRERAPMEPAQGRPEAALRPRRVRVLRMA